ncbi:MAG: DUF3159 domain-containing protein [Actinobacteria bacterium]|nr:DUF3159 domain-containing protein [Actinomycetota bacterium]
MSENADKAKILSAIGGVKGLIDSGLPALLFLITFNITKDVRDSAYAALTLSLLLTLARLVRRETIQHAVSGVIGVGICAWIAMRTGRAEDFYLPGLWTNAIYGSVYLVSIIARWPVIGLVIGPLLEENLRWRKDPVRTKVYIKATWLWVGMFAIRLLVQYPLYLSGNVNLLGSARLIMGYPLFIATAWATWLVIKSGPKLRDDLKVSKGS